jgi:uncharacterized membrane protein YdbT with pleckstrin-like domain
VTVATPSAPPRCRPGAEATVHASEGVVAAPAVARPLATSLAALLTRHILRDGEIVLLILKPSLWFIVMAAMRFSAVVLIGVIAAKLWMPDHAAIRVAELGAFLIVARVMWAVLQWMGRLYVLTDLRVLRLQGIFSVDIFDCPLRKVGEARLYRNFRERLLRLGSIEIIPAGEGSMPGEWRTIKRPVEVLETIQATVRRAKQGGLGL